MKTEKSIVVILLLILSSNTSAQTIKTIEVNFADLKNEYKTSVDYNTAFSVTVSNINKNLYKIDGVKTETDFNVTAPAALSSVKLPAYAYFSIPKTTTGYLPSTTANKSSADLLGDIADLQKKILALSRKFSEGLILNNDLVHLSKDCVADHNKWKREVVVRVDHFITGNSGNLAADPVENGIKLDSTFSSLVTDANANLAELNAKVSEYSSKASTELEEAYKYNLQLVSAGKKNLKDPNLSMADRMEMLEKIKLSRQFVDNYQNAKKQISETGVIISKNLDKATVAVEEINKAEREDKFFPIVKLYKQLISPNTFTYTSEIITAKVDEIRFTLTIEPTEPNTCDISGKRIVVIIVSVNGGVKIDFSTGAFISGGSNKFLGNTYYYRNIDANSRQITAAERNSRNMLSIGALMHLYRRSTKNLKLAGSVGISTTANLNDLNFHIGPSLLIGNRNRLVLSAGLILKSSPVLDQNLKTNITYTKLESPDLIPTVPVFPLAGYFFAISYNFSKFTTSK